MLFESCDYSTFDFVRHSSNTRIFVEICITILESPWNPEARRASEEVLEFELQGVGVPRGSVRRDAEVDDAAAAGARESVCADDAAAVRARLADDAAAAGAENRYALTVVVSLRCGG